MLVTSFTKASLLLGKPRRSGSKRWVLVCQSCFVCLQLQKRCYIPHVSRRHTPPKKGIYGLLHIPLIELCAFVHNLIFRYLTRKDSYPPANLQQMYGHMCPSSSGVQQASHVAIVTSQCAFGFEAERQLQLETSNSFEYYLEQIYWEKRRTCGLLENFCKMRPDVRDQAG